jgi:hypothetical protein
MTIQDAITKLRVMLNSEEVVTEVKMAEATLVDGTVVYTEGELAVGAVLYVSVEEGEAPFAPAGLHETTEGLLITVGENGVIEGIEEKAAEAAPVAEAPVEEAMSAEADALLAAIAEMIAGYKSAVEEEVSSISEEMKSLQERFNAVAGEPAAAPVKRNFADDAKATKEVANARFERLVSLRNKK